MLDVVLSAMSGTASKMAPNLNSVVTELSSQEVGALESLAAYRDSFDTIVQSTVSKPIPQVAYDRR